MRNYYGVGAVSPVFTPTTVPPTEIPKINWDALAAAFLNAGLTVYEVERKIAAEKARAAAAAAAGQSYYYDPGAVASRTDYMPYILGGVGLLAVLLLLKKR